MYLGAPVVTVADGPTPADATLDLPGGYVGPTRLVQLVTGLTDAPLGAVGLVSWTAGQTYTDTRTDPDAVGSRTAASWSERPSEAVTGSGSLVGATASAYVGVLVGAATGTDAKPADVLTAVLTTGHPYFTVPAHEAAAVWLQLVTTLGDIPPSITDVGGLTWTSHLQQPITGGYVTVWSAVLTNAAATPVRINLSEVCDSGIGVAVGVAS